MAAAVACGEDAVLSHRSAAALWGLLKPFRGAIHISVPRSSGRAHRPGIVLHRRRSLTTSNPPAVTHRDRIPVTTPRQTIDDLGGCVPPHLVRRAIRQAELSGLRLDAKSAQLTQRTRSDLELEFLDFCRRHRFPAPEVNVRIGRWTADFVWRQPPLAVEIDSFAYHRGSVAFEDDHRRDLDFRRAGFDVRRFTGEQLRESPAQVAADLHGALSS